MFISLKSLKACTAHVSYWLICHKTRNGEGVNVPCLSVLGLFGFCKVTYTLYWDENATKHTHMLCATVTDLHRLSLIQQSCCPETWTCPCRGRLNTIEVPPLLEAHDVGDAGAKRLKGNAIYGKAEGASWGVGNLLVFTMVTHQSTTS